MAKTGVKRNTSPKYFAAMAAMRLPDGEAAFNQLYGIYKHNAKRKNRAFILSKDVAKQLFVANCHYCGIQPRSCYRDKNGSTFSYNGIDRVDNAEGYIDGNMVTACGDCNMAKRSMSKDQFIEWAQRITSFQGAS